MTKKNIKLLIIILITITLSLSATYAYQQLNATNNNATGEGGCFVVNYSGEQITNSSIASTNDYTQSANSDIILSKDTDCKIYTEADIYIYTEDSTTAPISNGHLKYKIMQGSTEIDSGSITTKGAQLLTSDAITLTNTATTYTVYIWIDKANSKGTYHGTTYSGYLYATSSQTSTIQ